MNALRARLLRNKYSKFKKEKYSPIYGIFSIFEGKLYGYIENSFSMSWSDNRVRIEKEPVNLKTWGSAPTTPNAFIIRLSKQHPTVKIGPDTYEIKVEFKPTGHSYDWRNWYFTLTKITG